jgi:hypothetical protein
MKYSLYLLVLLIASSASAQLFPSRCFIPAVSFRDPADTNASVKYLTQQGMWGNLSRGFRSEGERFAWDISFGGFFELVQWKHSGISLVGDFEVLADTYNDISFNPRSIFWTEGFLYSLDITRTSDTAFPGLSRELSFGYIHHCRHDVDNLDYNTVGAHESRGLIYGSLMARYVLKNFYFQGTTFDLQLDQYLIRQDDRVPVTTTKPYDINKLNASISLGFRVDAFHWGDVPFYFRGFWTESVYNSYKDWTSHMHSEIGCELSGAGTRMNIFIGTEGFDKDDLNRPMPVSSDFLYIGFRFIGKNVGL